MEVGEREEAEESGKSAQWARKMAMPLPAALSAVRMQGMVAFLENISGHQEGTGWWQPVPSNWRRMGRWLVAIGFGLVGAFDLRG